MPELFADTSGWGNLVDPTQHFHVLAANVYRTARRQGRKVVTTNYILAELVALLTSPLRVSRRRVVLLIEGLKDSPFIEVVQVDLILDGKAWNLLRSRQDKTYQAVAKKPAWLPGAAS